MKRIFFKRIDKVYSILESATTAYKKDIEEIYNLMTNINFNNKKEVEILENKIKSFENSIRN